MSFESIVEELELDYTQKVLQKYSAQERAVIFECGNGCLIEVTTFCKPWLNKMTWLHGLYEAYTDPTGLQYVSDKSVITSGPFAGQSGYYNSPNYRGGLPGNIQQKGPGRFFQYDNSGKFYKDETLQPKSQNRNY